jgi:hypothetical protein
MADLTKRDKRFQDLGHAVAASADEMGGYLPDFGRRILGG